MPGRCCVPGCKANYASTLKIFGAISTFQFPKNEKLRKKWLKAISRQNWKPSPSATVCRLHFTNEDIVIPLESDYQRVLLKEGAVPSIFKSFRNAIHQCSEQVFKKKKENDSIADFSHLVNMYPQKLDTLEIWNTTLIDNVLHFFTLDISEDFSIKNQISIFEDLRFSVLMDNVEININKLQCFKSSSELKLEKWSQVQFLLKILSEELLTRKFVYFQDTKTCIEI